MSPGLLVSSSVITDSLGRINWRWQFMWIWISYQYLADASCSILLCFIRKMGKNLDSFRHACIIEMFYSQNASGSFVKTFCLFVCVCESPHMQFNCGRGDNAGCGRYACCCCLAQPVRYSLSPQQTVIDNGSGLRLTMHTIALIIAWTGHCFGTIIGMFMFSLVSTVSFGPLPRFISATIPYLSGCMHPLFSSPPLYCQFAAGCAVQWGSEVVIFLVVGITYGICKHRGQRKCGSWDDMGMMPI